MPPSAPLKARITQIITRLLTIAFGGLTAWLGGGEDAMQTAGQVAGTIASALVTLGLLVADLLIDKANLRKLGMTLTGKQQGANLLVILFVPALVLMTGCRASPKFIAWSERNAEHAKTLKERVGEIEHPPSSEQWSLLQQYVASEADKWRALESWAKGGRLNGSE